MKHKYVSLPLLAAAVLFSFASPGKAAPQPPPAPATAASTYVGSDVCATCHTEQADHLAKTPHGKSAFNSLSAHGCETCHGPASAHVENPDDPALRPRIERFSPQQQSAICQSCHKGGAQFFWHGGVHERRGLSCVSCHSIHSFKSENAQLKTASTTEACLSCHKTVRAEMWKSSHHPIREGKISCSDCHNPHGTPTPKMIKTTSVNDLCYTCHTEKRGPFLWEHAPVRESCLNCHTPHGSNHQKLQKTSTPYLCQQCHSNTRHPGTLYDGTTLADAARASNRIFNRACLDCHASVHGSNHPSSPYLGH
ncbi:MAG: DmsE family decaheme c-type cytochrome [Thermoanaerobaculia bacterium]